jgi:hypothetical protein
MTHVLELIGMAAVAVLFMAWKRRSGGQRGTDTVVPQHQEPRSQQTSDADDAYRVGFGIGMSGGSIEDAVIAQNALRSVEQKNGNKTDDRTLGTVLGLSNPPDSHNG